MKFIAFSTSVLLALCLPVLNCNAQTEAEVIKTVHDTLKDSPAGGLVKNKDAAILVFYRKSNKLLWLKNKDVDTYELITAKTIAPEETDDNKIGGPTPVGEYLIGQRYQNATHKIDWYRLYPRKEDNSGYYKYKEKTKKNRNEMGLHPGKVSLGCATVFAAKKPYDKEATWAPVRDHVDAGKLRYNKDDFSGYLIVVDK